jgi:phage-related protein
MAKKQNDQGLAEGIKETAGAAFHTVHSALETTENVAMSAVDAAKSATDNLTGTQNEKGHRNHD